MNEYFICSIDVFGEEIFLTNNGHWTPFLTDAKSFNSKEDAREFVTTSTYCTNYEIKRY